MKIKKVDINKMVFYMAYFILITSVMLNRITKLSNFNVCLRIVSYFLFLYNIILLLKNSSIKKVFNIIIIFLISILSSYFSKDTLPLRFIIVLLSSQNIEFNKFLKMDFIVRLLLILFVVIMHYIGLTNDYVIYRSDGTLRNSMGFSHPNVFGFNIMILCFEYIYIKYIQNKKFKFFDFVLLVGAIDVINFFSDSRSSVFAIILFLILIFLLKNKLKQKNFFNSKVIPNLFIIFTFFTMFLTYMYQNHNHIALVIDSITSRRLYFNDLFYNDYGFSFFGQKIITISTENARHLKTSALVLDNSYFQLLIRYGLCFYFIIELLFKKSLKKAFETKNKYMYIILVILIIFGISESNILLIEMCPFLLYFKEILFIHREENENE